MTHMYFVTEEYHLFLYNDEGNAFVGHAVRLARTPEIDYLVREYNFKLVELDHDTVVQCEFNNETHLLKMNLYVDRIEFECDEEETSEVPIDIEMVNNIVNNFRAGIIPTFFN